MRRIGSHLFVVLLVSKRNRKPTNSEADTQSSGCPYERDIQTLIHRNEPNRPHISSDINHVKQRRSKQNNKMRPNIIGAPRPILTSDLFTLTRPSVSARPCQRPQPRLSAAGEGVFRGMAGNPQVVFCRNMKFSAWRALTHIISKT